MNAPTVSVVIPSFNCEPYIHETLSSVTNQTYSRLEIIVVDDGSTDGTVSVAKSFGSNVKIVVQPNAGVCSARNRGFKESSGKYICFMDHDDYWHPEKIEHQVSLMESDPTLALTFTEFERWHLGPEARFPEPGDIFPAAFDKRLDPDMSGWIYHKLLIDCWILTSSAMIRSDVFEESGGFDLSLPYSEDWDLWLRLSRKWPMAKLRGLGVLYRQHQKQGNLLFRPRDYRTALLERAEQTWGLCSPDGNCLDRRVFKKNLAGYHADYGYHAVLTGQPIVAAKSYLKAWVLNPAHFKYLANIAVAPFFSRKSTWRR